MAGCRPTGGPASSVPPDTTLTVGYGLTTGENPQAGIRQAVGNIALEGLIAFGSDSRPQPWLAERWAISEDGLTWRVDLRQGVKFHDGSPVSAEVIRQILEKRLPQELGGAYKNIRSIRVSSEYSLEFMLQKRSAFLMEALAFPVQGSSTDIVGTGPFRLMRGPESAVEMRVNEHYYDGIPEIDRIVFKPYASVRSAWADMLRGEVDMLYEVGPEARDVFKSSSVVRMFTFERPYAYVVILNLKKPPLADSAFRRALNTAIDRQAVIATGLNGYGRPAEGPIWPEHWAYSSELPTFESGSRPTNPAEFVCLFADASLERLVLTIQKQLRTIGVNVRFELLPIDKALARVESGDFDAFLADAGQGPTLLRPYLFWYGGSPYNWGNYNNPAVNDAFDRINAAEDDEAYQKGVEALQRALVNDPPGIFLAWGERTRAVSTRFNVPVEPGRDILSTLRLWRPAAEN